jgi:hypothetical protein
VDVRTHARGRFDVVVVFVTRLAELERRFAALARALEPDGGLWVAWPKRVGRANRAAPARLAAVAAAVYRIADRSALRWRPRADGSVRRTRKGA